MRPGGRQSQRWQTTPCDELLVAYLDGELLGIGSLVVSDGTHSAQVTLIVRAGALSEKIKYGVTTEGVGSDFTNAMKHAHWMVWSIGMGESGLVGDFIGWRGDRYDFEVLAQELLR